MTRGPSDVQRPPARLMPAEWEPHEATWIAWPHHEPDWPGKIECIPWVYAEIVRLLGTGERVEILCHDESVAASARDCLRRSDVPAACYRCHILPTDRGWLRDSAPTAVRVAGRLEWIHWDFTAWAKYDNYSLDRQIPPFIEQVTGIPREPACRPDRPDRRLVLEGGAIDTDGEGTLLVTEECLLSDEQCRNPGLTRQGYEQAFARYLGIEKTIWLDRGCAGDDTHGHVDDIARFVAPALVLLTVTDDPADADYTWSQENLRRLRSATDARGRRLRVVPLPIPPVVSFEGFRLPASYANFYIGTRTVIVPTFNEPQDRQALTTIAEFFATRQVVGIHARDLVLGQGTLHCLSQQQPCQ
ncbi:MAG: agmatine deiminase family protein [Planctomycetes bacterium]|nr:agmatine deiminase family protein [Planctomycetota bacterium]